MRLLFNFEVQVSEINGTMKISEVKHISLTNTYEKNMSIEEIIDNATATVKSKFVDNNKTNEVEVVLSSIVPLVDTVVNPIIEEPVTNVEAVEDDFAANMNAPVNVVEEIPEGMVKPDDIEESPFTNTYYDETGVTEKVAEANETKTDETEYDYEDMFNKFLSLNFLTRQNLLIRNESWGPLLPEKHRGDRHKVAFPIAVEEAKNKGILNELYSKISELASES